MSLARKSPVTPSPSPGGLSGAAPSIPGEHTGQAESREQIPLPWLKPPCSIPLGDFIRVLPQLCLNLPL